MVSESRGLGRGLGALLGAVPTASASRGGGTLPIALMQAGSFQPRREIHRQPLEELAASIQVNGVIEPIIVRPLAAGAPGGARYEIVAGERRWLAAKLAGLTDIPTIVRQVTDQQAAAIALTGDSERFENEARALKRLIGEFSLTHQQAADAVGRSRAAVSNLMRLLDLPDSVVALIDSKALSMGHGRALLGLADHAERERLAQLVLERDLSVRATEKLVANASRDPVSKPVSATRPELAIVSQVLKTARVRVELQQKANGAGKLVVEFADSEVRERIMAAIREAALD